MFSASVGVARSSSGGVSGKPGRCLAGDVRPGRGRSARTSQRVDPMQWIHRSQHHLAPSADRLHLPPGRGSGYTQRTAPGTETIFWNAPFQKGESIQLINIANQPLGPTGACPADHPFEVNVSGEIGPGANNLSRSPVRATICANATDFVLKPGTLFTIFKK